MSPKDGDDFIKQIWNTVVGLEPQNKEIVGLTTIDNTLEGRGASYHKGMDVLNNQAVKRYSPTFNDKEAQKFLIAMADENYSDVNYRNQLLMDYEVSSPERATHLMSVGISSIYQEQRQKLQDYNSESQNNQLKRDILTKYASILPISQVITNKVVEQYTDKAPAYS